MPSSTAVAGRFRRMARSAGRIAVQAASRAYAIALIMLIVWLSYSAIRYLVVSFIRPTQTPAQISGVPRRLDEQLLHGSRPDWLGLQATENPRGPLAHFHRFDTWIEPDRYNDCARSGCHSPLPHGRRKELRAFLNMHATSLHCGVCHFKSDARPLPLVWYDLKDGRPGAPPAALRAYERLEDAAFLAKMDRAQQRELAALLRTAAEQAQDEGALTHIAREIENARPGSDLMPRLLDAARDAVRRQFRGSYGSKLAQRSADGRPLLAHPNTDAAVRDWLDHGAQAQGETRRTMLNAVHPLRRDAALTCSNCHRAEGSLVDFAALGYPSARIRSLCDAPIFEMIRHIGEGRPFHLPSFGGANAEPAATQPARQ